MQPRKLKFIFYITTLFVYTMFNAGCTHGRQPDVRQQEGVALYLTDLLNSQLLNVNRIDVQFGDGNKLGITDTDTIQKMVSQLRKIKVRESTLKGVGYLYELIIYEDDKVYKMNSNLSINGKAYEPVDNEVNELNKIVVKIGRERIPNLLSGIDIDE